MISQNLHYFLNFRSKLCSIFFIPINIQEGNGKVIVLITFYFCYFIEIILYGSYINNNNDVALQFLEATSLQPFSLL